MEEYKKSITEYADVQDAILYYEQKGREEGREEGEIQKSLEIAKNCLKKGLSVEMIAEITGLPPIQIESLKNHP